MIAPKPPPTLTLIVWRPLDDEMCSRSVTLDRAKQLTAELIRDAKRGVSDWQMVTAFTPDDKPLFIAQRGERGEPIIKLDWS